MCARDTSVFLRFNRSDKCALVLHSWNTFTNLTQSFSAYLRWNPLEIAPIFLWAFFLIAKKISRNLYKAISRMKHFLKLSQCLRVCAQTHFVNRKTQTYHKHFKSCVNSKIYMPFKYTISAAASAGETPEMRVACPRFLGLTALNFCLASIRRAWSEL